MIWRLHLAGLRIHEVPHLITRTPVADQLADSISSLNQQLMYRAVLYANTTCQEHFTMEVAGLSRSDHFPSLLEFVRRLSLTSMWPFKVPLEAGCEYSLCTKRNVRVSYSPITKV
jgi:hypothetical protein